MSKKVEKSKVTLQFTTADAYPDEATRKPAAEKIIQLLDKYFADKSGGMAVKYGASGFERIYYDLLQITVGFEITDEVNISEIAENFCKEHSDLVGGHEIGSFSL